MKAYGARRRRARTLCGAAFAASVGAAAALLTPPVASGAPAMPDPSQMSGIPRPDPAVPADQITVRCLLGGFSEPAVGVEVTLSAADGGPPLALKATTDAAGRATLTGLSDAAGRVVKASAVLGEAPVETLPIQVRADMGSRVLLVKGATPAARGGATSSPGGAPAHPGAPAHGASAPGAAEVEFREGVPFALPADAGAVRGPGTLVVGLIEPNAQRPQPQAGQAITIEIRPPGQDSEAPALRETVTDADGRAFFKGLTAPAIEAGSTIIVVAQVVEGEPPRRSVPFTMGDTPMAVVFTPSRMLDQPSAPPPAPTKAVTAQPPRLDRSLPSGTLVGQAIDATGAPVSGLAVTAERRDMTGQNQRWSATTDARGEARFDGLPTGSEGLYSLVVERDSAPFRSSFFELLDVAGLRAQVRTFPISNDRNILKSAVQVEVRPLENNESQVIQIYEVFAEGEFAYWPTQEVRIRGASRAHGLQVMPQAKRWLNEQESAPFATLARPIEPGEVVQLSTAYLLPHDGEAVYEWRAPFPLVQATAVLAPDLSVSEGAEGPGRAPPHEDGAAQVKLYEIKIGDWEEGDCAAGGEGCTAENWADTGAGVELTVSKLPTSAQWAKQLGVGLIVAFSGLIGGSLLFRRRLSAADALDARRASLLERIAALDVNPDAGDVAARRAALVAALDEVCRKLDSLRDAGHNRGA